MNINEVIQTLESFAPLSYQESYDNAGLLTGNAHWDCTGILCSLDVTEAVVGEAILKGCNLIVAHHPIVFNGLKKITGKNYVEKTIIAAIKQDIAIYAIHTNLDNVHNGVNQRMADKLNLQNCKVLDVKKGLLKKLFTYVPLKEAKDVQNALFAAGAGNIGNYSECSFVSEGKGTFKPGAGTSPFIGEIGKRETAEEIKLEVVFPVYRQSEVVVALLKAHPYEEVAYDIITLDNDYEQVGSGLIGELADSMTEKEFLEYLYSTFGLTVIKHTKLLQRNVKKVALCGGAGIFLLKKAMAQNADFYITSDVKYHEYFDAEEKIVLADIGHWESEQFTIDLLYDILQFKYPNFAVLKTETVTNPVQYFVPRL